MAFIGLHEICNLIWISLKRWHCVFVLWCDLHYFPELNFLPSNKSLVEAAVQCLSLLLSLEDVKK